MSNMSNSNGDMTPTMIPTMAPTSAPTDFNIDTWEFIPGLVNQIVVAALVLWMFFVCALDHRVFQQVAKDEQAKIPKTRRESIIYAKE